MASKTGYGVALAGFLGAVIAYATGDHSQAQLGSIVSASVGLISLAVTQVGRYVQANTQIRADAELQRLLHEGTNVVHTIDHYDPGAVAQLEAMVRSAVRDEVSRLAGGSGTVAGEVAGDVVDDVAAEITGHAAGTEAAPHADSPVLTQEANPLLPTPEEEAAQQPPAGLSSGVMAAGAPGATAGGQ